MMANPVSMICALGLMPWTRAMAASRVALPGGAAEKLPVDPAGPVRLGCKHHQPAEGGGQSLADGVGQFGPKKIAEFGFVVKCFKL